MKAYLISGLAADSRVFKHIRLPDSIEVVYLEWIQPRKKESLKEYALRMSERIRMDEPFVLMGLSMGGMIASEIARVKKPVKLILISSVPCSGNLPFYFRTAGTLSLYKLVPVAALKWAARTKRFFTTETNEDKKLLREVIQESDNDFIRWAVEAILKWKQDDSPAHLVHIHGNKDEVLPIRFTHPTHIIKGAGHMMILTHAREINRILAAELISLKK